MACAGPRRAIPAFRQVARAFSTAAPPGDSPPPPSPAGRGRGRGALSVFMEANRSVVDAFARPGGGPMSSDAQSGGKGKGGKGSFQGKGGSGGKGKGGASMAGGKGGKGMARRDGGGGKGGMGKGGKEMGKGGKGGGGGGSYESHDAVGKAQVMTGFKAGQFDDADSELAGDFDAMFDDLIDATMNAPNGCLVFDYEATPDERDAAITRIDQSNPRTIEELLGYARLEAAIGQDAASAPAYARDAWAMSSSNPGITHVQRVAIATHVAAHLKDFEKGNRNLLEFALTPPDDYVG